MTHQEVTTTAAQVGVAGKRGVLDDEDLNIFMIDQNWVVVSNIFYLSASG